MLLDKTMEPGSPPPLRRCLTCHVCISLLSRTSVPAIFTVCFLSLSL